MTDENEPIELKLARDGALFENIEILSTKVDIVWAHFYGDYKRRIGKPLRAVEEPGGLAKEEFHSIRPAARVADEPDHLLPRDFVEDRRARLVRKAIEGQLISLGRGGEILDLDLKEMRRLVISWQA